MLTICVVAFATSVVVCVMIIRSAGWHMPFTADHPGVQPQKFHKQAVPRVGGLGLMAGIVAAGVALDVAQLNTERYWLVVLCLLPAFFGGFAEDVTRKVGPLPRLLLTAITAACAYSLVGVRFVRSDVAWLDTLFAFAPFGFLSLMLAVAGVAHAMNIIDGYNGLSSGVGFIALVAMGAVAHLHGDALVAGFCLIAAAGLLGFLLFNYPFARLFLGDGGAYTLGSVLALAAAMLVQRNPQVSPWFPLVLVVYPVWETLFSILRRTFVYGTRVGDPDARHMHSLVYRRYGRRWAKKRKGDPADWRNPRTTLPFWLISAVMAAIAVVFSSSTTVLELTALAFTLGYCGVYLRLARLAKPIERSLTQRLRLRAAGARPQTARVALPVTDEEVAVK